MHPNFSAYEERSKQNTTKGNSEKCIKGRSNGFDTCQNMSVLYKLRVSIIHLKLKFNKMQNDYLNQTVIFLAGVKLKKKSSFRRETHSLISASKFILNNFRGNKFVH